MSSYQIGLTPNRRAAARFVGSVRRQLQKAVVDSGVSQSEIARKIGVNRSVISRELRGHRDLTLGRVAELAWAVGSKAVFTVENADSHHAANWVSMTFDNQSATSVATDSEKSSCDFEVTND